MKKPRDYQRHSGRTLVLEAEYVEGCEILPSEEVNQIQLYSLGVAVNEFDIALHSFNFLPRKACLCFTDQHNNARQFVTRFTELLDGALSAHLGRTESIWDGPIRLSHQ